MIIPSEGRRQILENYNRGANYSLTQPLDLAPLLRPIGTLEDFRLTLAKLPWA